MRHGFTSESLVVLVGGLRFKSGNRIEFLHLCNSETCQCAKHCALDFGDFGVLHGVHQCVLGASRVALQLGRCVLLTEGCDQRGILQHLLSTTTRYSRGVRNTGSDLLDCCAADCLCICSAATMTCVNGSTELNWLAGSVVVLNSCSATMCELRVFLWFIGLVKLLRPPTASPVKLGTGVLWVSTGTHPCGSPSRQDDGGTRAPALHTLDDVPRFRGDEEYRAVLLYGPKHFFFNILEKSLPALGRTEISCGPKKDKACSIRVLSAKNIMRISRKLLARLISNFHSKKTFSSFSLWRTRTLTDDERKQSKAHHAEGFRSEVRVAHKIEVSSVISKCVVHWLQSFMCTCETHQKTCVLAWKRPPCTDQTNHSAPPSRPAWT